ncbi:hypothetical protein CEXT_139721 [Caerostris extrusa]|uniref:Uncharacterized protein n=1 Tax=Caerostris extrusa TaxID=172846 RepID=A0AAV4R2Q9_CAEEX|nr:hypothetical protein CEXT_139721 [Caerostris extrusa]
MELYDHENSQPATPRSHRVVLKITKSFETRTFFFDQPLCPEVDNHIQRLNVHSDIDLKFPRRDKNQNKLRCLGCFHRGLRSIYLSGLSSAESKFCLSFVSTRINQEVKSEDQDGHNNGHYIYAKDLDANM